MAPAEPSPPAGCAHQGWQRALPSLPPAAPSLLGYGARPSPARRLNRERRPRRLLRGLRARRVFALEAASAVRGHASCPAWVLCRCVSWVLPRVLPLLPAAWLRPVRLRGTFLRGGRPFTSSRRRSGAFRGSRSVVFPGGKFFVLTLRKR